jgi:prepilin-type N-terminal cleavage/methylation domain-containing protein
MTDAADARRLKTAMTRGSQRERAGGCRRGFTLIELVVALTIAGLIALAARAALVAGIDTQDRVQAHTMRTEGDARFRAIVVQALRHMVDAPVTGIAPFVLRDTIDAAGKQSHVVEFYSRGLALPAGTGAVAHVRLEPLADGLTITAVRSDGVRLLRGVAPGIAAFHARLQTPAGAWLDAWPRSLQIPSAVALELTPIGATGPNERSVPLIVTTRLEPQP